jgi:hypothetical protein
MTNMFRVIHDRRGATALETTLVLLSLVMFIFGLFDLSRYALTLYSLSNLANEAARQQIICYSPQIALPATTVTCPSDPLSTDQKQTAAPALFWGDLTQQKVETDPTSHVITASVSNIKAAFPILLTPFPIPIFYPSTLTVTVNLQF